MNMKQSRLRATFQRFARWRRSSPPVQEIHTPSPVRLLLGALFALAIFAASPMAVARSGPLDLVLLLDTSSAVQVADTEQRLRDALTNFIRASDSRNRISLISYDDLAFPIIPLTRISHASRESLSAAIGALEFSAPNSNLAAGLERAIYEFDRNGNEKANRHILLIHSGEIRTGDPEQDESFRRWATDVLAPKAAKMAIHVQGISFGTQADVEMAQSIADITGGMHAQVSSYAELNAWLSRLQPMALGSNPVTPSASLTRSEFAWLRQEDGSSVTGITAQPSRETTGNADESAYDANEITAGVNQLNQGIPTQAGVALTSDSANPAFSTTRMSPGYQTKAADPSASSRSSNEPSTQVSPTDEEFPTFDQNAMVLWIAIGVLSIGLVAALVAFWNTRRTNKRLSVTQARTDQKSEVRLVDLSGISGQSTYTITDKLIRVCRNPGRDSYNVVCLTIPEDVISREHAFIEVREGSYFVTDRGSDNGTYVNGRRVDGSRKLKDGDRIYFATFEFAFECPAPGKVTHSPGENMEETIVFGREDDAATIVTEATISSGGLTLVHGSKGRNGDSKAEVAEYRDDTDRTKLSDRTLVQ